jgi:hypothetical protein
VVLVVQVSAQDYQKKGYKVLVVEKEKWFEAKDFQNQWELENGCGCLVTIFFGS